MLPPTLPSMTDSQAQEFAKLAYAMLAELLEGQKKTLGMSKAVCAQMDRLRHERDTLAEELLAIKSVGA